MNIMYSDDLPSSIPGIAFAAPPWELDVLTEEEARTLAENVLAELGCSYAELKAMRDSGNYASIEHRLAWIAIGGS